MGASFVGAAPRMGDDMRRAYRQLHERGYAHSIEVWRDGELVGGLYGVALGRVFFGESMFSRVDDGSKIALYWLCRQLDAWAFEMVDCQVSSAHLSSLGATELPRIDFLRRLALALDRPRRPAQCHFQIERPADPAHLPS